MRRIEIDESQHELERAALQLEAAAARARFALENERSARVAERALLDSAELVGCAMGIIARETTLIRVS